MTEQWQQLFAFPSMIINKKKSIKHQTTHTILLTSEKKKADNMTTAAFFSSPAQFSSFLLFPLKLSFRFRIHYRSCYIYECVHICVFFISFCSSIRLILSFVYALLSTFTVTFCCCCCVHVPYTHKLVSVGITIENGAIKFIKRSRMRDTLTHNKRCESAL